MRPECSKKSPRSAVEGEALGFIWVRNASLDQRPWVTLADAIASQVNIRDSFQIMPSASRQTGKSLN
jgi:hypothetical protein